MIVDREALHDVGHCNVDIEGLTHINLNPLLAQDHLPSLPALTVPSTSRPGAERGRH